MQEENLYHYRAITSDGDIYFNLKDEIGKVHLNHGWYLGDEEIQFINKNEVICRFIKNATFGITYSAESKRFFLTKEIDQGISGYDFSHTLEYLIQSKEEWERETRLREKIEKLKQKLKYQPGGIGYQEALEHFETIKNR